MMIKNQLCFVLLLILSGLLFFSESHVSMTWDEPQHIASGYSKIVTGDFRMNTEHPPLLQVLEGLPLIFLKPKLDIDHESWVQKDMLEFTRRFFFVDNNNPGQMLAYARVPVIIFTVLLGFVLFAWANEFFGARAAFISLMLYVFEPNILAHGMLATTDMGFAFFAILALYCYQKFFNHPSVRNLFFASVTMGLAQLTKYTAIFLFPIYFLIILTSRNAEAKYRFEYPLQKKIENRSVRYFYFYFLSFAIIIFVSVLIINMAYLFQQTGIPIKDAMLSDRHLDKKLPENMFGNPILRLVAEMPSPLPYYYVKGFAFVINEGRNPSPNIVLGQFHRQGVWYYFIAAFAVKTTIAVLLLTVFAIFVQRKNSNWQFTLLPVFALLFFLSGSTKQLGIRYAIALFPLLFLWIGGKVSAVRGRYFLFFLGIILAAHAVSSLSAFPDYLSYYNEFVGSENGYEFFVDSNTDWGQDFDKLVQYARRNPGIKVKYSGTNDLSFHGLKPAIGCEKGLLAVSVREIAMSFTWLSQYTPMDRIGNSIFVYNITTC